MTIHITGTFEVNVIPDSVGGDPSVGRFILDKQFFGALEATSKGQMLTVSTDVESSAGYVAMERVNGTLKGRAGTFALQHYGLMMRGTQQLKISVVPDSGTGQLTGLAGTMIINADDSQHSYEFDYTLPE